MAAKRVAAKATVGGEPWLVMFIPVRQHVWKYAANTASEVALARKFVVRTAGEPSAVAASVRAAIKEIDPGQPVDEITTLRQIIARKVSERNFAMVLLSLFGRCGRGAFGGGNLRRDGVCRHATHA